MIKNWIVERLGNEPYYVHPQVKLLITSFLHVSFITNNILATCTGSNTSRGVSLPVQVARILFVINNKDKG